MKVGQKSWPDLESSRHDFSGSELYKRLHSPCLERGFKREKFGKSKEATLRLRVFD